MDDLVSFDDDQFGLAGPMVGKPDDRVTNRDVLDGAADSSTIPARSLPCPEGNVAGHRLAKAPSRIAASPGLIPAAFIRTRTWLGPGTGRSTSTRWRMSMPP